MTVKEKGDWKPSFSRLVLLLLLASPGAVMASNPCLDTYPAMAGEVLTSDGGRVKKIAPVEWFEDGVYQVTVESGGVFMTRLGDLPMPELGSDLEFRIYSKDAASLPMAGCYCRKGTDICVEEYSYP